MMDACSRGNETRGRGAEIFSARTCEIAEELQDSALKLEPRLPAPAAASSRNETRRAEASRAGLIMDPAGELVIGRSMVEQAAGRGGVRHG